MRRNDPPDTPRAPRARKGRIFDAFDLVQQRATLRGHVDAADFPRVAEALADDGGRIDYEIRGTSDEANRPALEIAIDGELQLTCQRCLKAMRWPASQRITVLLAHDARELAQLDDSDEHEVVLADAPLDPVELVEDELLLTMPYAPRHPADEGAQCAPAPADDAPTAKAPSPFGALAGLKARADKRAKR